MESVEKYKNSAAYVDKLQNFVIKNVSYVFFRNLS